MNFSKTFQSKVYHGKLTEFRSKSSAPSRTIYGKEMILRNSDFKKLKRVSVA